jgi:alpha-beta hydrolase superfamily lysophospholipase
MPIPAWKTKLADLLNDVWPTFTLPSGLNAADLSRNPEVGRKYAADPLVGDRVSARYYNEVTRVMADTVARAPRFAVPLLLVQGSADLLTSPAATAAWFAEAGTASGHLDKTMKVYDGFFHELHNEDEHALLFADLKEWLARYPEV